jgi:hypothetical protein
MNQMSEDTFHLGPEGRSFKFWSSLDAKVRDLFIAQALVYFPEILGTSPHKYQRFAEWLASRHGILCTNVRDVFGAGGKRTVTVGGLTIRNAPKILTTLLNNSSQVRAILSAISEKELAGYLKVKPDQIRSIGCAAAWEGNASLALVETMDGHPDAGKLRAFVKKVAGLSV